MVPCWQAVWGDFQNLCYFSVSGLKDWKVDRSKPTWELKHANSILDSRVFWIFLPNVIKIDPYNFELYRFKLGAFFLRHSVVLGIWHAELLSAGWTMFCVVICTKTDRAGIVFVHCIWKVFNQISRLNDCDRQINCHFVLHFSIVSLNTNYSVVMLLWKFSYREGGGTVPY